MCINGNIKIQHKKIRVITEKIKKYGELYKNNKVKTKKYFLFLIPKITYFLFLKLIFNKMVLIFPKKRLSSHFFNVLKVFFFRLKTCLILFFEQKLLAVSFIIHYLSLFFNHTSCWFVIIHFNIFFTHQILECIFQIFFGNIFCYLWIIINCTVIFEEKTAYICL